MLRARGPNGRRSTPPDDRVPNKKQGFGPPGQVAELPGRLKNQECFERETQNGHRSTPISLFTHAFFAISVLALYSPSLLIGSKLKDASSEKPKPAIAAHHQTIGYPIKNKVSGHRDRSPSFRAGPKIRDASSERPKTAIAAHQFPYLHTHFLQFQCSADQK